jgi:hypothetical protein
MDTLVAQHRANSLEFEDICAYLRKIWDPTKYAGNQISASYYTDVSPEDIRKQRVSEAYTSHMNSLTVVDEARDVKLQTAEQQRKYGIQAAESAKRNYSPNNPEMRRKANLEYDNTMTKIQECHEQTSDEIEAAHDIEVEKIQNLYKTAQSESELEYRTLSEMYEAARERKRAALY